LMRVQFFLEADQSERPMGRRQATTAFGVALLQIETRLKTDRENL
jgi:hypothetical protein